MTRKIYIHAWGGLGDIVLTTPAFRQLKQDRPDTRIIVLSLTAARLQVLQHNPYIDELRPYSYYYKLLHRLRLIKIHGTAYGKLRPSYSYKVKAPEIIAEMLGVTLCDKSMQLFVTEEEDRAALALLTQYKNPVIMQITSNTTRNQMWPVSHWNELVAGMPEYNFIQVGSKEEDKISGAIDLRGCTTVREVIALVKNATSFVGVVSFLSHVAGAFQKNGVVLFGGVSAVAVWGHACNINIVKRFPCSPCVDTLHRSPCPYNKPCMSAISVAEVRAALCKQAPCNETNC